MNKRYVYVFECPYHVRYRSDLQEQHCEAANIRFRSAQQRREWMKTYCCNHGGGWNNCCLKKSMDKFYDEVIR